jgi:hypothetical protein
MNENADAQFAHKPLHGAPGHGDALTVKLRPILGTVDSVIGRPDPDDLGLELLIAHRPGRDGNRGQDASDDVTHGSGCWDMERASESSKRRPARK